MISSSLWWMDFCVLFLSQAKDKEQIYLILIFFRANLPFIPSDNWLDFVRGEENVGKLIDSKFVCVAHRRSMSEFWCIMWWMTVYCLRFESGFSVSNIREARTDRIAYPDGAYSALYFVNRFWTQSVLNWISRIQMWTHFLSKKRIIATDPDYNLRNKNLKK